MFHMDRNRLSSVPVLYCNSFYMRALEIVGLHEYTSGLVYCVDITPSFTSYSTTADFRRKVCRGC